MSFYLATFKIVLQADNTSHAEDTADEILGDLLVKDQVWGDDDYSTYDVQKMPSSYHPDSVPLPSAPPGVVHPWDQGLWIFPEDHPLHAVEMLAKQGDEGCQSVLDETIKATKALNP